MAIFEETVCIISDQDLQKLEVTKKGDINFIHLYKNITSNVILDIIADDVGDFWISDIEKNIRKI